MPGTLLHVATHRIIKQKPLPGIIQYKARKKVVNILLKTNFNAFQCNRIQYVWKKKRPPIVVIVAVYFIKAAEHLLFYLDLHL